jgi:hypothetical protein
VSEKKEKKEKKDKEKEKEKDKETDKEKENKEKQEPKGDGGSTRPSLPPRASVPPPSERSPSPKLADAVKTNKQSGGFRAMKREETTDEIPAAARVSVPMPSSKDRKSGEGARDTLVVDEEPPAPAAAAHVSKPMTPTDLPGTRRPSSASDDSS